MKQGDIVGIIEILGKSKRGENDPFVFFGGEEVCINMTIKDSNWLELELHTDTCHKLEREKITYMD